VGVDLFFIFSSQNAANASNCSQNQVLTTGKCAGGKATDFLAQMRRMLTGASIEFFNFWSNLVEFSRI
jgi:hypothetical protein